jgi:thiamine-phosphate pyrophosphorylase
MGNSVAKRLVLPRLYVILDATLLTIPAMDCAQELAGAGVRLMQYRDKTPRSRTLLPTSRALAVQLAFSGITFIVNDRPDIAVQSNAAGVHVGQEDAPPSHARAIVGAERIVGVSTHNLEQFREAVNSPADYIAVGPIFATNSKANPDPVVGTEFIRKARALTDKPIVAIGGITLETAAAVINAGADSVAVISDILRADHRALRARQYLDVLGAAKQAASA